MLQIVLYNIFRLRLTEEGAPVTTAARLRVMCVWRDLNKRKKFSNSVSRNRRVIQNDRVLIYYE
jgi:hypothetical protein